MPQREPDNREEVSSPTGFTRFYREHLPAVFGYLVRLTDGNISLAEDLTQDTFVALTTELRRGKPECADVRWLLTVARHRFLDHVRREASAQTKLRLVAMAPVAELPLHDSGRAEVLAGLQGLEPLHRVVLMMRYVDELGVPDIAEAIGRNTTATHSLLARAREQMRRQARDAT